MRLTLATIPLLLSYFSMHAAQFTWKGGTGNYDDPTQWDVGAVPTFDDDVYIESGTIIFPANGVYEANTFQMEGGTLDFQGTSLNAADINIYGDLEIALGVTTIYDSNSSTTWFFMGSGVNHKVSAKGVDLNKINLDDENSQVELATELIAERTINIKNGSFDSNGYNIFTGSFVAGGSCLPNCVNKNLNLGSSTITCTDQWSGEFNYGSLTLSGTYTIKTPIFKGGIGVVYYDVELLDYDPFIASQADQNIYARDNTFHDLIINNSFPTKMAGDITVNGTFEVVHQNSDIYISKEPQGDTEQWTFNGTVDLPVDQGGCLDLTRFIAQSGSVSETFTFHSASANLVFDYAYIEGIPTSGGGSFTVNTGHVAGYNSDWSMINPHPSKTLYWIGGTGNWHDGSHWSLSSGGSAYGCPPSIVDDVIFDANSFNAASQSVNLSYNAYNVCRDLQWAANPQNAAMNSTTFAGNYPNLDISGNIEIDVPVDIDMGSNGKWNLIGDDEFSISSVAVLPRLSFLSESGYYLLESDIESSSITFYAGGLETQGFDMIINGSWNSKNYQPKFYNLGSSTIEASGSLKFGDIYDGNVTVNAGTSYLIGETFTADNADMHIVEINSTGENQFTTPVTFQKLILNGTNIYPTNGGITIDTLVFNADGSDFKLSPFFDSHITKTIISNAAGVDPPQIRSFNGVQAKLIFDKHNPCLEGPIAFWNVEAENMGIVNAPDGIDDGGNAGLNFVSPPYTGTLHWIGGQGYWATFSNWSTGSGGCPTSVDPQFADQLVFDDYSFTDNDTIFIDPYRVCNDMLFENTNYEAVLYLGRRLVPDKVEIDGGAVVISNNTDIQPFGTLWVDENVSITNGGSLTLDEADLIVGRRPTNLVGVPALYVDFMSTLIGINGSVVGVAGSADDPSVKSVDIEFGANVNGLDMDFTIVFPINGQPLRDLYIDLSNRYFKKLLTNVSGTSQKYHFVDDARFGEVQHNYGTIVVNSSVSMEVEEF